MLALVVWPFDDVWNLTFVFDLLTPNDPRYFFPTISFVEGLKLINMYESYGHAM